MSADASRRDVLIGAASSTGLDLVPFVRPVRAHAAPLDPTDPFPGLLSGLPAATCNLRALDIAETAAAARYIEPSCPRRCSAETPMWLTSEAGMAIGSIFQIRRAATLTSRKRRGTGSQKSARPTPASAPSGRARRRRWRASTRSWPRWRDGSSSAIGAGGGRPGRDPGTMARGCGRVPSAPRASDVHAGAHSYNTSLRRRASRASASRASIRSVPPSRRSPRGRHPRGDGRPALDARRRAVFDLARPPGNGRRQGSSQVSP